MPWNAQTQTHKYSKLVFKATASFFYNRNSFVNTNVHVAIDRKWLIPFEWPNRKKRIYKKDVIAFGTMLAYGKIDTTHMQLDSNDSQCIQCKPTLCCTRKMQKTESVKNEFWLFIHLFSVCRSAHAMECSIKNSVKFNISNLNRSREPFSIN